jgi:hypothetical protein
MLHIELKSKIRRLWINQNPFKLKNTKNVSNLRIVSMIPGDRKVAGCLVFSNFWKDMDGNQNENKKFKGFS